MEEAKEDPALLSTDSGNVQRGAFLSTNWPTPAVLPTEARNQMITRSILLAALVVTSACRAIPEESSDTAGYNLEDTAQTDTVENVDETGTVDSDTAQEIDTDTPSEDSGDTATIADCTFEVGAHGGGRVEIGNELQFSLSSASPSGESIPGYQEVMRFNIASLHPECDEIEISTLLFRILATDNASTEWLSNVARNADVYDLSTDGFSEVQMTAEVWTLENDSAGVSPTGSIVIGAGEAHTIVVYMDTTGISQDMDDALRLDLDHMLHLAEFGSAIGILAGDDVTGGTLVF